jgi:hypothetical protein
MAARGRPEGNKTQSERDTEILHNKIIHGLSLSIFSENGAEGAAALHELLRWSAHKGQDVQQHPGGAHPSCPQATACLVNSLTRFIGLYCEHWIRSPTAEPCLTAIVILSNLVHLPDPEVAIKNAALMGAIPETVLLLHRLSFDPFSPLARMAQIIMLQVARFCRIKHTLRDHGYQRFVAGICSLFALASASADDAHIAIFLNFIMMRKNCRLFLKELGSDLICRRMAQLLAHPLMVSRDLLLEAIYALAMTNLEIKDAVCNTPVLLRAILRLAVPPSEPYEAKVVAQLTPCQKACVLLLELAEDSRVVCYLARFKTQIAAAMLKWKSCALPELALKVSNARE